MTIWSSSRRRIARGLRNIENQKKKYLSRTNYQVELYDVRREVYGCSGEFVTFTDVIYLIYIVNVCVYQTFLSFARHHDCDTGNNNNAGAYMTVYWNGRIQLLTLATCYQPWPGQVAMYNVITFLRARVRRVVSFTRIIRPSVQKKK